MHRPLRLLIESRVGRISIFPLNPGFGSGLPRRRTLPAEPASDSYGFPRLLGPSAVPAIAVQVTPNFDAFTLPVSAGFRVAPVAPASPLQRLRYRS
jgi:hypothetical protein